MKRAPRLPWPTLDRPFELTVDEARVDGKTVGLPSTSAVGLHTLASGGWQSVSLDITARLPDDFWSSCKVTTADIAVTAVALDGQTNSRIPIPMVAAEHGRYVGTLDAHRAELAGRCTISAVATSAIANVSHRELARSADIVLDADEPIAVDIAGRSPFPMVWTDFASPEEGAPTVLQNAKDSLFWFDQSTGQPVLWLNDGIEYFTNILLQERPRGRARDAQNFVGSWVASQVWTSLAERAMADLSSGEDGEAVQVLDPLSDRVLDQLSAYTEGVADKAELVEQMAEARSDGDARRELNARLQLAIARVTSMNETITRSLKDTWHA